MAQQTLDAATPENVQEMQQVLRTLFLRHSQAAHTSRDGWLILVVDLTGIPCGKQAENSVNRLPSAGYAVESLEYSAGACQSTGQERE